jgi:hypothetical protein
MCKDHRAFFSVRRIPCKRHKTKKGHLRKSNTFIVGTQQRKANRAQYWNEFEATLKRIAREVVVAQARIQPTHTFHPPPTRLHVHYATTTPDKPQPSLRGAKQIVEHQSEVEHAPLDAKSKATGTDKNRGNNKKQQKLLLKNVGWCLALGANEGRMAGAASTRPNNATAQQHAPRHPPVWVGERQGTSHR